MKNFFIFVLFMIIKSQDYGIGEIRNLDILGIIDKRLVIKYYGKESPVAFYIDEVREVDLFPLEGVNKNLKYGIKKIKFIEFHVPHSEKIVTITNRYNMTNFKYNRLGFLKWIVNSKNENIQDKRIIFFKIKNNGEIINLNINEVIEYYEIMKKSDL